MEQIKNHPIDFDSLFPQIMETLKDYMAIGSFTGTADEKKVEPFLQAKLSSMPYFVQNPADFGFFPVPEDGLHRQVAWGLVRGKKSDTVCLLHHYDVVGVEDFKSLKDLALHPDALEEALRQNMSMLSEDAAKDLASGAFLFGKGGCDMKAGGSIELNLLREYGDLALQGELEGSVLLLAVPDEENLSAGMRAAALLMEQLQKERGLSFRLMINAEPHMRRDPDVGVFSLGSIGKVMPFVYVRGSMSHAGKVFEGVNPLPILSDIIRRTELNMDFTDTLPTGPDTAECSLPPTWLYAKDSKTAYDVSMPLYACGYVNVLTLTSSPEDVLKRLETICQEAMQDYLQGLRASQELYLQRTRRKQDPVSWKVQILRFDDLLTEAKEHGGDAFLSLYEQKMQEMLEAVEVGEKTFLTGNEELVSFVFDYVKESGPRIVIGLIPPYYPCVSNLRYEKEDAVIKGLFPFLRDYAENTLSQAYEAEYFFTGLSDLSYVSLKDPAAERTLLKENMPFFGHGYDIPLEAVHAISMPCINVGPWGKDFHKLSERVLIKDVAKVTPRLIDIAVRYLFSNG